MSSQPQPVQFEPAPGPQAVEPRQAPHYPKSWDRTRVRAFLLKSKWEPELTRFYVDAGRICGGALQTLCLGIALKTIHGPKGKGKAAKRPEWTPPMLAVDWARETGFTEQMMLLAIKEGIAKGILSRQAETGPEAYQLRLLIATWKDIGDAFKSRALAGKEDGEDPANCHETVVSRVCVAAGRKKKLGRVGEGEAARDIVFENDGDRPLDIGLNVPQSGPIEIHGRAPAPVEVSDVGAASPPRKSPAKERGRPAPSSAPGDEPAAPAGRAQDLVAACANAGLALDPVHEAPVIERAVAELGELPADVLGAKLADRVSRGRSGQTTRFTVGMLPKFVAEQLVKWKAELVVGQVGHVGQDDPPMHPKDRERLNRIERGAETLKRREEARARGEVVI